MYKLLLTKVYITLELFLSGNQAFKSTVAILRAVIFLRFVLSAIVLTFIADTHYIK